MGESLVVHAAKEWKFSHYKTSGKLRITIIDREAELKKELLCLRYYQLEKVYDLIPLQIDIKSNELTEEIKELDRNTVRAMPSLLAKVDLQVCRIKKVNVSTNS